MRVTEFLIIVQIVNTKLLSMFIYIRDIPHKPPPLLGPMNFNPIANFKPEIPLTLTPLTPTTTTRPGGAFVTANAVDVRGEGFEVGGVGVRGVGGVGGVLGGGVGGVLGGVGGGVGRVLGRGRVGRVLGGVGGVVGVLGVWDNHIHVVVPVKGPQIILEEAFTFPPVCLFVQSHLT